MSDKFSYSRIDTYDQCKFKYKLRYIDKHYVSTDSIATELGTIIHETEEAIANAIMAGEAIDYIQLKNKIILTSIELAHKYPEAYWAGDKSNRTCHQKLYEYLRGGIYRLENFLLANSHLSLVATEKEFEFTFQDTTFYGFIDRILYDSRNQKYIVQDLKTYAVPIERKNLEAPLQFVVYTHAMKELFGVSPEQIVCEYDLPFCSLTQRAGSADFMAKGDAKLGSLLNSIDNKDFTPSPTPLCHWCEYCPTNPNQDPKAKNLCPYHSLWTKTNKTRAVASRWAGLENHELVLFEYIKCQNSTPSTV